VINYVQVSNVDENIFQYRKKCREIMIKMEDHLVLAFSINLGKYIRW